MKLPGSAMALMNENCTGVFAFCAFATSHYRLRDCSIWDELSVHRSIHSRFLQGKHVSPFLEDKQWRLHYRCCHWRDVGGCLFRPSLLNLCPYETLKETSCQLSE